VSVTRALFDHLAADAGVSALVGTRIYQELAPAGSALPRITFSMVSEQYQETLQGATTELAWSNVQIDAWGSSIDSALAVAEAVRQSLQGYIGSMGTQSLEVPHATVRNRQGLFSEPESGADIAIYRVMVDARIINRQTVPALP
jgi:hypothetical protein